MIDDNVHMQNSVQFVDALQRAGKEFEMMFYPQSRHGIGGQHYLKLQLDGCLEANRWVCAKVKSVDTGALVGSCVGSPEFGPRARGSI